MSLFISILIKNWKNILIAISVVLLLITGFMLGKRVEAEHNIKVIQKINNEFAIKESYYKNREIKLENDLKQSIETANQIKEKVVVQYVDKIKIQKEKEYVYRNSTNQIPDNEKASKGLVYNHNTIVTKKEPEIKNVKDDSQSNKSIKDVMNTVTENYGICEENKQQLESLQKWIKETKDAVDKKNDTSTK